MTERAGDATETRADGGSERADATAQEREHGGEGEGEHDHEHDGEGGPDHDYDHAVEVDWGESGLVPAVAQDADSGAVLMLAYVDREALARTRETGLAHYHSRSRDELWQKGGSSGHVQHVESIQVDCDGDALLYRVHQEGGACHTGFDSCFHRDLDGEVVGERVFDPEEVYDGDG